VTDRFEVAVAAVREAGEVALGYAARLDGLEVRTKGVQDVVTEADLEIELLLRRRLLAAFPDDAFFGEETGADALEGRAGVWVVDPIDGTRAFANGLPEFAISVALLVRGAAVLGVVANPATGEWFEAERACGAWQGEVRLRASTQRTLEGARLLSSRTEMRRRHWPALMPEASFTDLSSLAYKLALVASGRFDGLISRRASHDWDLAAAQLLIDEAGGLLTSADGADLVLNQPEPYHPGLVAAGTHDLHRALLVRLASAQPEDS
jgi:myo-inositol-1(or 4)-monophosphatase